MRAALAVALVCGCAHVTPLQPHSPSAPEIRQLDVGRGTNAFLVMGARPILVDTGWGDTPERLLKALRQNAIDPRQLALVVLTHGHGDHAGGASRLKQLSPAPIAAHRGDVPMLQAGHNRPLRPMSFTGKLLRSFSDKPFPPFTPDLILDGELDLSPYGVDGKVVPMPGHTPGSVAVILPTGDALVGDLLRGELVRTHTPTRHLFHDDCRAAESHLGPLVQAGVRRLWVGHGGPLDAAQAAKKLQGQNCR